MSNNNDSASQVTTTATVAPKARKARSTRKVAKAKPAKQSALANVRHKSKVQWPVALVHAYCDAHPKLRRKDALAALDAKGIAYYTVRTQYQVWFAERKARLAKGKRSKAKSAKAKPAAQVAA